MNEGDLHTCSPSKDESMDIAHNAALTDLAAAIKKGDKVN